MSRRIATEPLNEMCAKLVRNIELSIKGKREVAELAVTALVARGHVLFEDVPGVGKTTLSLVLARSLGLEFRRIQCTADMMPQDVLGAVIFDQKRNEFEFKTGPIFTNIALVDEINRATPKTQSALLEAMGEGTVTVEKISHKLPQPFWVVATQNPLDTQGTHALPENQLDRFLMRLSLGYPDTEAEQLIVQHGGAPLRAENVAQVVALDELQRAMAGASEVKVEASVAGYVVALCQATRTSGDYLLGASTRAAVALIGAAKAHAWMHGRNYVLPDDVSNLWLHVMNHRVVVRRTSSYTDKKAVESALGETLRQVAAPT